MSLDPRTTLVRGGLASRALEGLVSAERFVEPSPMVAASPVAGLHRAADPGSEQLDQLLFGERFDVLDTAGDWAFGQARRDGYVGFVRSAELAPAAAASTHRVAALRAYAFAEPNIKSRPSGPYSLNALVAVEAHEGRFVRGVGAGWFVEAQLAPIGADFETDAATVAERFLGAPYLWGGRQSVGLDCSGLVQQALYACGRACPRDTDQQAAAFPAVDRSEARRGDLVFWRGHVAILLDDARIIHANAHHMAVAIEKLDDAITRIAASDGGEPTGFRRP